MADEKGTRMAILARSFQTPTDCGHSVAWEALLIESSTDTGCTAAVDQWSKPRTCPKCRAPVGFLSDIGTDDDAANDTVQPMVYFKYGKMVYRLYVPCQVAPQKSYAVSESWWRPTFMWRWGFSTDTSTLKSPSLDTCNTAQARIQSFLGISHGMKVSDNFQPTVRMDFTWIRISPTHLDPVDFSLWPSKRFCTRER
jgi:hypothetical protein